MIIRCDPREILGLCDEIARLRKRLADVEATCVDLIGRPYWHKTEALRAVAAVARGAHEGGRRG